ncbi:MAG: Uma2 family endonuclease [bacterium]|nr:Uma2 family endonuclease [bacterium]
MRISAPEKPAEPVPAAQAVNSPAAESSHETAAPYPHTATVSEADYMEHYAHARCEWVKGVLIPMSPVRLRHDQIDSYLRRLLEAYLSVNTIGIVVGAPFVMRLDVQESRREPDLQIILEGNPGTLTDTAMVGAADICVEIVSEESTSRDYGDKFNEYEAGGVREYWIIDPVRQEYRFFRLTDAKRCASQPLDAADNYRTPLLPGLAVHVPTLWSDPLPGYFAIADAMKAMLTGQAQRTYGTRQTFTPARSKNGSSRAASVFR